MTDTYVYRPKPEGITFDAAFNHLKARTARVLPHGVDNIAPPVVDEVCRRLTALGIPVNEISIDSDAYAAYLNDAGYSRRYPHYYPDNIREKSLEHYLALQLLAPGKEDVFVDIASEHSPVPEIFERLTTAKCYAQDIMFESGLRGRTIGGDACAMPVADAFATKAALTCSLEHFEQDADTRLFLELARVLGPGGSVVVIPFYIFTEDAVQTDPTVSVPANVQFDREAAIYCSEGWGNRHGRFYSPEAFARRIVAPTRDTMKFEVFRITNPDAVGPGIYLRLLFKATRL